MGDAKKLALLGAAVLLLYLAAGGRGEETGKPPQGLAERASESAARAEKSAERDCTVSVIQGPGSASEDWEETFFSPSDADEAVAMTISGEALIKNETGYPIDPGAVIEAGCNVQLPADGPQILIIHTHSSEAYTQAGLDRYEASDTTRTEDSEHNIIRVGDELYRLLESAGLNVIHDRGVYDYPSYTGSYGRSGAAVEQYLKEYPTIRVVFDVHRDALGSDGVIYKTVAEEEGTCASQAMLLVGTDESGLEHPNWRENLSLALYLQDAVLRAHPTLMRPLTVVPQRYNQQLCHGMMILEVGSNGNTLQEALAAVRLFGEAAGPALAALVAEQDLTDN